MATTPSVRVLKTMLYKSGTKTWSNRYHFNGGTPSSTGHWNTLFDAIVAAEKLALTSDATIVECIGYAAGSDVPVASKTYSQPGTATPSNQFGTQGNTVALVRYSTTARSSKNHPVYLFNYYHTVTADGTVVPRDKVNAGQKALLLTYANAWIAGFSDGTITAVRAGPNGATAVGVEVEDYLTHRDFPN